MFCQVQGFFLEENVTSLFQIRSVRTSCFIDVIKQTGSLALIWALFSTSSLAQNVSVERDPFSEPSINEVVDAADRERVARITRDLVDAQLIEMELRIINEVEERINANTERLIEALREEMKIETDERISNAVSFLKNFEENLPNLLREQMLTSGLKAESGVDEMEGATFIACVDGIPLYRDQAGSTFYINDTQGDTGVSRCNN